MQPAPRLPAQAPLANGGCRRLRCFSQSAGFNCLFIFPPCYVALCASKARHRFGSEVSWCLETSLFLRLPSRDGTPSLPLLSLFLFFIFFLPLFEDLGFFSGCLMSSAGIQKLFCGIYSAFKCSFNEFVGEKVFSPSYSSAILAPPRDLIFKKQGKKCLSWFSCRLAGFGISFVLLYQWKVPLCGS